MTALTDAGRAQVRRLGAEELDAALALVWETFLAFEAPEYPPEGVEQFRRDVIDSAEYRARCASDEQPMWGAFIGGELAGVMCLRAPCHISLAFVATRYQRRGVGTALMGALLEHVKRALPDARQVTVNSSPYGVPFYRALGFCDTDCEKCVAGMRFVPMALSLDESGEQHMSGNIDRVRASFARQAPAFEGGGLHFSRQDYLMHMADCLAPARDARVLETAAGTCACGRVLAPRVASVTCLDATPEMLAMGRAEALKAGICNIDFVNGRAEALPFADGSFDMALTRLSFHHFPQVEPAFGEMDRVLRRGGTLAVIDMLAAAEPLRGIADRIETLRDPSHVRTLSREDLLAPFRAHGYSIEHEETARFTTRLSAWMELTQTPAAVREAITRMMLDDMAHGAPTGFAPFMQDGEICFEHRWLMLIGRKR